MGYLGLTPFLSRLFVENYKMNDFSSKIIASTIAGLIAAPLSHPLDTMKTSMQGDVSQAKYTTMSDTYQKLLKEGGKRRFFNGLSFRTFRTIAGTFIINESKLRLAPVMFKM
jgi:solute carrier family 25 carnitine/acylcarnitine transporter 20/29